MMSTSPLPKTAGLTLVEILVAITAGSILIGATTLLVGRLFGISREQTEQVRITEDARIQMERASDAIRDAQSIDLTQDGLANIDAEYWLQYGSDYDIQFYTNLDSEPEIERVHYFLEGSELKRGVRDPYSLPPDQEQVTVIAKSVRNRSLGVPLFRYPGSGQTPVINKQKVKQVEIILVIDVNENQEPGAATVSTIVTPRASEIIFVSPVPSVSPSFSPPGGGGTSP